MSKEYWAEVRKGSYQEEIFNDYKRLEGLYLDYWKDKSILTELCLYSKEPKSTKPKLKIPPIKKNFTPLKLSQKSSPRKSLIIEDPETQKTDYRTILRRYQRKKTHSLQIPNNEVSMKKHFEKLGIKPINKNLN